MVTRSHSTLQALQEDNTHGKYY